MYGLTISRILKASHDSRYVTYVTNGPHVSIIFYDMITPGTCGHVHEKTIAYGAHRPVSHNRHGHA